MNDPGTGRDRSSNLEPLLTPFLEQPGSSGIFVDFDGTLAPIVLDHDAARPQPEVLELLPRLAQRFRRVAVVSGRPVAYLAENLSHAGNVGAIELVGLYGLERVVPGMKGIHVAPEAERWRQTVESVAREADRRVSLAPTELAGLGVERKGLTVTLHYRKAPELAGWVESFAEEQTAATGLAAHPGKMSLELRPPIATDKGTVVAALAEGLVAVCYLGDDRGDLPAFEVLSGLRRRGVHTLAVAVRSGVGDETPSALLAAADLIVDGPEGAVELLRQLAGG